VDLLSGVLPNGRQAGAQHPDLTGRAQPMG
jgi:hypothetical protein